MKSPRSNRAWIWGAALLLLVVCGAAAWLWIDRLRVPGPGTDADYWPADTWRTAAPEEQGFDSARLADGLQALQDTGAGIDSLLIIRNGYVLLDARFYPYDGSFPHDLASVTKSVMTTLIGIAADQGKIDLDEPMVSFFPERAIANLDERKEKITVRHLAGMVSGMESGCLDGDEATLDAMRSSPDWVQAALDRKMVREPGSKFCYDSPGMHILSAILQESTGLTAAEFAAQYLFGPLGINEVAWESDPQGHTRGWGHLHLKPGDVARLGYLWLHQGAWDGRQIVSGSWVSDSIQPRAKLLGSEFGYGYGWWVSPVDYYAMGREGQYLRIIPSHHMIVVATGGGYDFGEVESFLIPSLLGSSRERPANPGGIARLDAALANLAQPSDALPSRPLPKAALAVSGKTYTCKSNVVALESLRFDFAGARQASLHLEQYGKEMTWPIGLDGTYRVSTEGQAQRGHWEDSHTFILEVFDIGVLTRRFQFTGNGVELIIPEVPLRLECQVQSP